MYRPFHPPQQGYPNHNYHNRPYFRTPYQQQHGYQNYSSPQQSSREFWCETCDRDFRSGQQLETHKQQHQTCKIDGCQFVAHPKVITKHIQMQHSSGLFKKIAKLNNPEEISKWREERKKKYPTKVNIENKVAEIKEKISRGEKMCLNRDRNTHRDNSVLKRKHSNISNDNQQRGQKKPQRRRPPPKVAKLVSATLDSLSLKPFSGIQNIVMGSDSESEDLGSSNNCGFIIEDEEDGIPSKEAQNNQQTPSLSMDKLLVCGALNNLMCNYGSSDEECDSATEVPVAGHINNANHEDKTPNVDLNQPSKLKETGNQSKETDRHSLPKQGEKSGNVSGDDDNSPEEVYNINKQTNIEPGNSINVEQKNAPVKNKTKFENHRQPPKYPPKRYKPKPPSTLLGNLLKQEIRHERNVVLQCVRYIVKNNYFDKNN